MRTQRNRFVAGADPGRCDIRQLFCTFSMVAGVKAGRNVGPRVFVAGPPNNNDESGSLRGGRTLAGKAMDRQIVVKP